MSNCVGHESALVFGPSCPKGGFENAQLTSLIMGFPEFFKFMIVKRILAVLYLVG